jgi:hypothetical protein
METILGFGVAALGAGLLWGIKRVGFALFLQKFGPTVKTVFDVIDPIAGELIGKYDNSVVQEAIELAVLRVADGNIDHNDVVAVSEYVIAKFNPALAAAKALDPTTEKGKATAALSATIQKLADGADADELKTLARKAIALV